MDEHRSQLEQAIAALHRQLAELDAAAPDEQRKLATVLFADLAGWTQMASNMDPEDVQAIQQAYFQAVTAPIEAYGGSVEKYVGDAVLAAFGVPQAHADDPERAVRAAPVPPCQGGRVELQSGASNKQP